MAIDGITEAGGVVTLDRFVVVKGDLKIVTDLNVTGNVAVSGSLLVEDTITEGTPTVKKTFALVIPGVTLAAATKGYTVSPCPLSIIQMIAVKTELCTLGAVLTIGINESDDAETLVVTAGDIGEADYLTFVTPPEAAFDTLPIRVYSDAAGIGTVNVTLICEET